ncbi:MAG: class I SAM-dependent methyltransferase [Planctomycetes bacterium]|nr:class I SAM-dependent methyltransferase [Planctomycetota bacterium]
MSASDYGGCSVPAEVYDIAFGWDPQPEVERLLFLAREAGCRVSRVLELGCGSGRLLAALEDRVAETVGVELSSTMAEYARQRCRGDIITGDMTDFALNRTFDLVFASANTIRHVLDDKRIAGMWKCIAQHLQPGGVFVADVELGVMAEAERLGRPARWMNSRGDSLVHVLWDVAQAPTPQAPRTRVRWEFELRGPRRQSWQESFDLRAYEADEFLHRATEGGGLEPVSIHELRDPYLFAVPVENVAGRVLVTLRRCRAE